MENRLKRQVQVWPAYQRAVGRHDTQHKGPAYPLAIVVRGPSLTKGLSTQKKKKTKGLSHSHLGRWQRALLNATSSVGDKPCGYCTVESHTQYVVSNSMEFSQCLNFKPEASIYTPGHISSSSRTLKTQLITQQVF